MLNTNQEPFYLPIKNEIELFLAGYKSRLPIMLKGPTGCGKTRFIEHMAHVLNRNLITVACHEDLFASDLVGRYILKDNETIWVDGPLTCAVKNGSICYLDEIVEARKDTTVVIHPLTDNRRILSIEKRNQIISAHPDFCLVVSYNPGYQSVLKDLKQSTRQRFIAINFDYPDSQSQKEAQIVAKEAQISFEIAHKLVLLAGKIRQIKEHGLTEGASTRLLIYTAKLINNGISPLDACISAICMPLTDDAKLYETLNELIKDVF